MFVNNVYQVDLLEPPANLLKLDARHLPFVLCIEANEDDFGDDPSTLSDNYNFDYQHCNFDEIAVSLATVDWSQAC